MVEPDSMSVVELYHVHVASAENTQGVSVRIIFFIFLYKAFIRLFCVMTYLTCLFLGERYDQKEGTEENLNPPFVFLHA